MAADNEEQERRRDEAANRRVREAEAENSRWLEQDRRDREPGARNGKLWGALAEVGRREASQAEMEGCR